MKNIILTAQEVRDFDKKKTLTVEKPLRPSFEQGQAVYIREPWKRIGDKNSKVFHYASDAVSGADSINYFNWASPVSMPADAIRYYGRVVKVLELTGTASGIRWEITIEKISKSDAEIIEAGIPLSDADDEEDVSDTVTYKGDMTPEDFTLMQELNAGSIGPEDIKAAFGIVSPSATIGDSPEKRLEEIRVRRQWLLDNRKSAPFESIQIDLDILAAEERAILKAAGMLFGGIDLASGPDMTIIEEPQAIEEAAPEQPQITYTERLEDIRLRRQKLDSFTKGKILSEIAETEVTAEYEALAAEEIAVMKAAGFHIGFDFAAIEITPEAIEPNKATQPPEDATTDAPPPTEEPAQIKATSDRISAGQCPFCGKAWLVVLSSIPTGTFLTQEAVDAAAGRACKCEGPMSFYTFLELPPEYYGESSDECNEPEPIEQILYGACRHCGQSIAIGGGYFSQEDANRAAEDICTCPSAIRFRNAEQKMQELISQGQDQVFSLFGERADKLGFEPIAAAEPVDLLLQAVRLIAQRHISGITVQIRGYCRAKVGRTSKGKINVERSEAHSCKLEAGE